MNDHTPEQQAAYDKWQAIHNRNMVSFRCDPVRYLNGYSSDDSEEEHAHDKYQATLNSPTT